MSGVTWAALSGIGFGVFQALNARAVRELDDAYVSTFLQLLIATAVLAAATLVSEDIGRIEGTSLWGLTAFALAGLTHFLIGWTTLNISQARIGAARSSPLLSTAPLFGLVFAAVILSELPDWLALAGIALTVVGAYIVAEPGGGRRARLGDSGYALATAAAWALSPIFTVEGLKALDSPLLGVTIGILAATMAQLGLLLATRRPIRQALRSRVALGLKLAAGIVAALATWGRWVSLDDAAVSVVLSLQLLSVPVVLLLAPLVSGRTVEVVTGKTWAGASLVVMGSLVLISLT